MLKIGHRGAAGYEPENTLSSFKRAIQLGVDIIELDVHECKTGELVVFHDSRLNGKTDGKGFIFDFSLNEIKKLKLFESEKIPTLCEALDFINRRVKVNIEIKSSVRAESVSKVIEEYVKKKRWRYSDFIISSFNHKELIKVYKLNPKIQISLLVPELKDMVLHKSFRGVFLGTFFQRKMNFSKMMRLFNILNDNPRIKIYSVNTPLDILDKMFVEEAHKHKIKVFVWTIDSVKQIEKAKSFGVDGIISNFPDRIK
jgi:glycerophosphoryl diester phosphodiesterase